MQNTMDATTTNPAERMQCTGCCLECARSETHEGKCPECGEPCLPVAQFTYPAEV